MLQALRMSVPSSPKQPESISWHRGFMCLPNEDIQEELVQTHQRPALDDSSKQESLPSLVGAMEDLSNDLDERYSSLPRKSTSASSSSSSSRKIRKHSSRRSSTGGRRSSEESPRHERSTRRRRSSVTSATSPNRVSLPPRNPSNDSTGSIRRRSSVTSVSSRSKASIPSRNTSTDSGNSIRSTSRSSKASLPPRKSSTGSTNSAGSTSVSSPTRASLPPRNTSSDSAHSIRRRRASVASSRPQSKSTSAARAPMKSSSSRSYRTREMSSEMARKRSTSPDKEMKSLSTRSHRAREMTREMSWSRPTGSSTGQGRPRSKSRSSRRRLASTKEVHSPSRSSKNPAGEGRPRSKSRSRSSRRLASTDGSPSSRTSHSRTPLASGSRCKSRSRRSERTRTIPSLPTFEDATTANTSTPQGMRRTRSHRHSEKNSNSMSAAAMAVMNLSTSIITTTARSPASIRVARRMNQSCSAMDASNSSLSKSSLRNKSRSNRLEKLASKNKSRDSFLDSMMEEEDNSNPTEKQAAITKSTKEHDNDAIPAASFSSLMLSFGVLQIVDDNAHLHDDEAVDELAEAASLSVHNSDIEDDNNCSINDAQEQPKIKSQQQFQFLHKMISNGHAGQSSVAGDTTSHSRRSTNSSMRKTTQRSKSGARREYKLGRQAPGRSKSFSSATRSMVSSASAPAATATKITKETVSNQISPSQEDVTEHSLRSQLRRAASYHPRSSFSAQKEDNDKMPSPPRSSWRDSYHDSDSLHGIKNCEVRQNLAEAALRGVSRGLDDSARCHDFKRSKSCSAFENPANDSQPLPPQSTWKKSYHESESLHGITDAAVRSDLACATFRGITRAQNDSRRNLMQKSKSVGAALSAERDQLNTDENAKENRAFVPLYQRSKSLSNMAASIKVKDMAASIKKAAVASTTANDVLLKHTNSPNSVIDANEDDSRQAPSRSLSRSLSKRLAGKDLSLPVSQLQRSNSMSTIETSDSIALIISSSKLRQQASFRWQSHV